MKFLLYFSSFTIIEMGRLPHRDQLGIAYVDTREVSTQGISMALRRGIRIGTQLVCRGFVLQLDQPEVTIQKIKEMSPRTEVVASPHFDFLKLVAQQLPHIVLILLTENHKKTDFTALQRMTREKFQTDGTQFGLRIDSTGTKIHLDPDDAGAVVAEILAHRTPKPVAANIMR